MPSSSLVRQLGLTSATALVVSNMVGTGIFTTTGFMAGDLGSSRLILLVWVLGAGFALCGALSYAELGINFPRSGGEYIYLSEAYGPVWGFLSGWVSFFAGFSAPIAAAALAFSHYLGYAEAHAKWIAAGVIAFFTALNCLGIGKVARLQNVLTGIKVAVIVAFVCGGLWFGSGHFQHFTQPAIRNSTVTLPAQVVLSLLWVMVGYSGWNAATYIAEEIRNPERTLPRALVGGTTIVIALYLGLNTVFIYATPLEQMKGVVAVGSQAAANLFGGHVAGVFSALMAVAILSTVNAMVTIGPRVYYAMAKAGSFPQIAGSVHPRFHVPVIAIMLQGFCAMLMTASPFPDLVIYIGFSLTLFTTLAVASLFRFRRSSDWQTLPALDFTYPLIPAAYLVIGLAMLCYGIFWQPVPSLAAFGTLAVGALLFRRYKK